MEMEMKTLITLSVAEFENAKGIYDAHIKQYRAHIPNAKKALAKVELREVAKHLECAARYTQLAISPTYCTAAEYAALAAARYGDAAAIYRDLMRIVWCYKSSEDETAAYHERNREMRVYVQSLNY